MKTAPQFEHSGAHTDAIFSLLVLWAWTAAAGRTFCVLKGCQNALFGAGRGGKV